MHIETLVAMWLGFPIMIFIGIVIGTIAATEKSYRPKKK